MLYKIILVDIYPCGNALFECVDICLYCNRKLIFSVIVIMRFRFVYVSNIGATEIAVYRRQHDNSLQFTQVRLLCVLIWSTL